MAGEIDFRALSPGINYGQMIASFDAGNQSRVARETAKLEAARLQRLATQDANKAKGDEALASWFESMAGGDAAAPTVAPTAAPDPAATGLAPVPNAPGAGVVAPVEDGADITVTAQREPPKPNPTAFLAAMARAGQGEVAMKLFEQTRALSKEQRQSAVEAYTAMDSAFATLATVPYEQRKPLIAQMAPGLIARGVPEATIANFDPTDAAITAARNNTLGIKGLLEFEDKAADNARQERALALTERGQNITLRGQDISRGNAQIAAAGAGGLTPRQRQQTQVQLRKEFDALPEVKAFKDIAPVIMSARRAPDTPAGDIQLAYTVGKILDPGSVVREGELAMVAKAGSPLERIIGTGRFVAGEGARLTPKQRNELLAMLNERALANRQAYDAARGNYQAYAQEYGIEPRSVVGTHVADAYARQPGAAAGKPAGPVRIRGNADYAKLPSGAVFIAPDGSRRVKP